MKLLAVLGIARVGRVLSLLAAATAAAAAAGAWGGIEWERGRQAQAENRQLRTDASELRTAAEILRARANDIVQDMQTSARRMDLIAARNVEQFHAIDHLYIQHRDAFELQLATAAAAELLACRIGALGMRVWNEAAAGFDGNVEAAAGEHPGGSAGVMPAGAAEAHQRFGTGSDPDVAAGGADVPPLPSQGRRPDRGRP